MKLLLVSSLFLLVPGLYANQSAAFTPHRIPYNALVKDSAFEMAQQAFLSALEQDGIVSITGIPSLSKQETLATLHACALDSKDTAQEHTYHDGTRRLTMATQSLQDLPSALGESAECQRFHQASTAFRRQVDITTQLFTNRLSSLLSTRIRADEPLLRSAESSNEEHEQDYDSLESIVTHGQHLEHFHSYQKSGTDHGDESNVDTVDIHTDQGLLLVFSPALLVEHQQVVETLQDGFYIQRKNGSRVRVQFDETDDLVFMLGDGVNQYVNPNLVNNQDNLYATPHAVHMPVLPNEHQARVWYGRMVLPPSNALVAVNHNGNEDQESTTTTTTYGQLRQDNIQGNMKHLACSSTLQGRQLEKLSCEADELFCWEKCMSASEYNVSETICGEQGLNLTCTNEERQLYISGHGAFFPGCIDLETATNVTGNPTHPSEQNNTNHTDGDGHDHDGHTHDGGDGHEMTSGVLSLSMVGSFVASVLVAGMVGVVIMV